MEGITIMPLLRGTRSDRVSNLAPDELQNVQKAKESTWDQMMELFLTPCNRSPADNKVKQNGYERRGPVDVDTCESIQVVIREKPEEEDLLDYVFENVESTICRGDAETENEAYSNKVEGVAIHSLRRNNSLIDLDDVEADMSTDGNSQKPRNGDELFVSSGTGEIVHISEQGESERTRNTRETVGDRREGNPDLLDYVFQNTESFVCGESIMPEEMIVETDEDNIIIGACSVRDQDPEPLTYAKGPKPPTKTKGEVESPKVDDVLDHTESFVGGKSITPQDMKVDAEQEEEEDDGTVGACYGCYNTVEYSVDTNEALFTPLQPQYYEDAFEAENAELVGMVVAPYALNRDISVISTISNGEVSQATTATMGNVTGAQKTGHKKESRNLLGGVFGRRREKR
jgi:hypothetical protein